MVLSRAVRGFSDRPLGLVYLATPSGKKARHTPVVWRVDGKSNDRSGGTLSAKRREAPWPTPTETILRLDSGSNVGLILGRPPHPELLDD